MWESKAGARRREIFSLEKILVTTSKIKLVYTKISPRLNKMNKISIETAKEISHLLVKVSGIKGIDIFGSVARDGYGADFDLIILTDQEKAQEWWVNAKMRIRQRSFFTILYHKLKKVIPFFETIFEGEKRKRGVSIASDVFKHDLVSFFENYKPKIKVDITVLPENWRDGGIINFDVFNKLKPAPDTGTIGFFERIAKDAKRLI